MRGYCRRLSCDSPAASSAEMIKSTSAGQCSGRISSPSISMVELPELVWLPLDPMCRTYDSDGTSGKSVKEKNVSHGGIEAPGRTFSDLAFPMAEPWALWRAGASFAVTGGFRRPGVITGAVVNNHTGVPDDRHLRNSRAAPASCRRSRWKRLCADQHRFRRRRHGVAHRRRPEKS